MLSSSFGRGENERSWGKWAVMWKRERKYEKVDGPNRLNVDGPQKERG